MNKINEVSSYKNYNKTLLKFYYQISYKPNFSLLNNKKSNNNKLFFKNFLYFFLILNFLKNFHKNLNYSFIFLKKKKYFKSYIKSPNRYKNSQKKLCFLYYIGILTLRLKYNNNNINFNIFYFFYYFNNVIFLFNLFETTLLALQKNYVLVKKNYKIF